MSKFQSRQTLNVLFALVAFALILAAPASLSAQKRKAVPPSTPTNPPSPDSAPTSTPNFRSADQAMLEMAILMSRRISIADMERERHRLASQLAHDLERLGQINDQQIVPLSSAKSLDYRNLAQASAEIRAHATRIKFYSPLGLNDRTGVKIRFEADASQLGAMLPAIGDHVGFPLDDLRHG